MGGRHSFAFFALLSPSSLVSGSELKIPFFALALNLLKRVIILAERSFLQLVPRSADVSSLCVMRFFYAILQNAYFKVFKSLQLMLHDARDSVSSRAVVR